RRLRVLIDAVEPRHAWLPPPMSLHPRMAWIYSTAPAAGADRRATPCVAANADVPSSTHGVDLLNGTGCGR
ncbi:hypothetical protein, partial [Stenotrophomonas maltophilia group sp. CASM56]|uniref:hypothetical protein n=1 Tax=Stenotrophomonas maltophilia group sp. CASM56 TaxID=3111516 RepID=UPI003BF81A26